MMICPNCGASNPNGATFCSNCGTKLQASAYGPNGGSNPYGNPNPTQGNVPPQYTGTPVSPNGSDTIENRNIALCIIFSFITCGIYMFYWMYTMTEDTNSLSGDPYATSGGVVILLSIVTCGIYALYWLYKRGEILDQAKMRRGMPAGNSGILYLILSIVGLSIISYALIQNELNNFAS